MSARLRFLPLRTAAASKSSSQLPISRIATLHTARNISTVITASTSSPSRPKAHTQCPLSQTRPMASHTPSLVRWTSSKSLADEKVEEITELYATAQDEFEIASEETEKQTVYAEEDRRAAREELTRLQEAYAAVLEGPDKDVADEVKRRVGHRIRELENGVKAMEQLAMEQD